MIFDDGWSKCENILVYFLGIGLRFVVACLYWLLFIVKMAYFEDFVRRRFVCMSMIKFLLGFFDFNQVLALCILVELFMKSIKKCVLLIFKSFFVAGDDGIFIDVTLFKLSNLFKGSWNSIVSLGLSVFERLIIILFVYFKGSKGSIDHTVNYNVINL